MTPYQYASKVEAYYDAKQADLEQEQEDADEAYRLAEEDAHRELTFDDLLEELEKLSDQAKEAELRDAAQGKASKLLAHAYERFLEKKTGLLLDRVIKCSKQIKRYN